MDPFRYIAIWGIPPSSQQGFDLLVARQLLWMPHSALAVRQFLFTENAEPICPACGEVVKPGTPSVVCAAVLADRELLRRLRVDVTAFATRDPDARDAWWLMHGACRDEVTAEQVHYWNQRIELALRVGTRTN